MINQGRYIINAFFILLVTAVSIFIFKKIIDTEPLDQGNIVLDHPENGDSTSGGNSIGKSLFFTNCAACHAIFKDMTGPALAGVEERGPWKDRRKIYEWIQNPSKFMINDQYTMKLKERYGIIMTAFSNLDEKQIDAILDYINNTSPGYMPVAMQ